MEVKVNKKKINTQVKSCKELADSLGLTAPDQAIGVLINDQAEDLSYEFKENDDIIFFNFQDFVGKQIFWHTSAHVLAQAVIRLWPKATPVIGPAIKEGFYFDFDNLTISEKDFSLIEKEVKKIISENLKLTKSIVSKEEALSLFSNNPFKREIIKTLEGSITVYRQKEFLDLCRGPHLYSVGKIKAFKLLKTSGAYWQGNKENKMLTRIYGISFPEKKQLTEYLIFLEEAKKRDHKLLGQQLSLFSFVEEAAGMPFFHPNGMHIFNELVCFIKQLLKEDYEEIKTPIMLSKELWEQSGHWEHYRENMYISEIEKQEFAIKPMNCPGGMIYYKSRSHSYKELPLRIYEIGLVHRHELSGSINGLFRVRSFHQDDAHVIMQKEDIKNEIIKILILADKIYMTFGLSYKLELSTRPEKAKTIGLDEDWEFTTKALKEALDEWGHSYSIVEGEGAFYGPKIDLHIKDSLNRYWQCGTIQLDMSLPEKFDLRFMSCDQKMLRPIMLHRALFGSLERFIGILIEHFAGKFPFWISPLPIRIIPIADRHVDYALKIKEKIQTNDLLCDIDNSHESVNKKIRKAQMLKINYMLTIGDLEVQNKTISIRTRDNVVHGENTIEHFIEKVIKEKNNKELMSPFSIS